MEKIAKRTMQEEAQTTLEHVEIDGNKVQGDGDRAQMVE